jgi:hypothetical protein
MSRNTVSILLSIIFWAFLTAPSVLSMIDDSIDISILYESSEEEEKGSENIKDIEITFSELNGKESDFALTKTENYLGYYSKSYPKLHLNLISPPPEIS